MEFCSSQQIPVIEIPDFSPLSPYIGICADMPFGATDRVSPRERKYVPPPASTTFGTPSHQRTKDDLHNWSIFRQNLTSCIADGLLNRDAAGGSSGLLKAAGSGKPTLPYGDFQMHDQTVESVLNQGRREDHVMAQQGEVYLRYGLPRVNLEGHRRSHSELDLRRVGASGDLDFPDAATGAEGMPQFPLRGPYALRGAESFTNIGLGGRVVAGGRSMDKLRMVGGFQSENFLDTGHNMMAAGSRGEYAHSDATSSAMPGLTPVRQTRGGLGAGNAWNFSEIMVNGPAAATTTEGPSGYWDVGSRRHHHGHYFSNLNLFTQSSNPYNYLHYAKAEESQLTPNKQPHLLVRELGFDMDRRTAFDRCMLRAPRHHRVIDNVSFELYGGETLAIMYSSSMEAKILLNALSNYHRLRGHGEGYIIVNGLRMKREVFGSRAAYVCLHDLYPDLTVQEHLKLTVAFRRPATSFKTRSMISQLVQTLALAPFRDKLVRDLGRTEKSRVKLACQILLDTDIILLEDILKSMDLYDAAFLVDYLKDWAQKLNRIVITTFNPPTYELLSMFYKTAVLASGRFVYFGKPSKLTEYFESMGHPCPLFKSPCDYFVDLVTLDTLSLDALKETKERIKYLADSWLAKSATLPESSIPGLPPPKVRKPNCFVIIWWLYVRFWWLLSNRPWNYVSEMLYAAIISALFGVVFLSLSETQGGVSDRFSLIFCLLTIGLVPNLLQNVDRVHQERALLFMDAKHSLYSKGNFYIAKVLFDIPFAFVTYMCYLLPVFFMSGLYVGDKWIEFGVFTAIFLLYCTSMRLLAWMFAYVSANAFHAFTLLGFLLGVFALTTGTLIHSNDVWFPFRWTQLCSPTFWAYWNLNQLEFAGFRNSRLATGRPGLPALGGEANVQPALANENVLVFSCQTKQVQYGSILTTLLCPIRSGPEALAYANFSSVLLNTASLGYSSNTHVMLYYIGVPVIAAWGLLAFLLNFCFICCNYKPNQQEV